MVLDRYFTLKNTEYLSLQHMLLQKRYGIFSYIFYKLDYIFKIANLHYEYLIYFFVVRNVCINTILGNSRQ